MERSRRARGALGGELVCAVRVAGDTCEGALPAFEYLRGIVPLGIPTLAGPGAITTVIALNGQTNGDLTRQIALFLAIIIVLLIPLALKGVKYRPLGAAAVLRRSLLLYGAGGIVAPFVGIKLIDLALAAVGAV